MDIRIGSKIVPINKFIFSHANSWPSVHPMLFINWELRQNNIKIKPNSHDPELLIELGA